jgi:hypothetical protein
MQPTPRQLPPGTQVKTLQQQEQERAQQEALYQQWLASQAQQGAPAGGMRTTANQMPFPGSNPDMGEPGLLAQTMDRIGQFFGGDKTLAVPAERNPLAAAPGVGIGGEARRKAVDEEVERASGGKRR